MIAVPHYISPKDYLDIERDNPIRHEYRRGLVYAMVGGTDNHDRITFNLLKLIDNHFGDPSAQRVECRRRTNQNTWETTVYDSGAVVRLTSISLEFAIGELSRGLDG